MNILVKLLKIHQHTCTARGKNVFQHSIKSIQWHQALMFIYLILLYRFVYYSFGIYVYFENIASVQKTAQDHVPSL